MNHLEKKNEEAENAQINQDASKTLSDHSENDSLDDDSHPCKCISRHHSVKKNALDDVDNKSNSVTSNQACCAMKTSLDQMTMAILERKDWKESKRVMKERIKVLEEKNALYVNFMRADEERNKDLNKVKWYL
jgi:hypothetical protein